MGSRMQEVQDHRDYIVQLIAQMVFGCVRRKDVPLYRVPYPEHIDREFPYPREYRILDFARFSEEEGMAPMKHVECFTRQSGEAANTDPLKLCIFPNSLTGGCVLVVHSLATQFDKGFERYADLVFEWHLKREGKTGGAPDTKRVMQEYEKERKTRALVEEVCDELAKEIGEDKSEVEALKKELMKL